MKRIFLTVFVFFLGVHSFGHALVFYQSEATLNKVREAIDLKQKGVYLRFGDGEILTACGGGHSQHQPFSPMLREEMREAFALNGEYVLKCLPLYTPEFGGYEKGMSSGNHLGDPVWCKQMLEMAAPCWNAPIDKVYSHVALSYLATENPEQCIDFLLFLKSQPNKILVGNRTIPAAIRELLFGKDCKFIPTPPTNAYNEIDRIEKGCKKALESLDGYTVLITCTGASGKPLQKRIYNQFDEVFLFDFGSLMDALTNAWKLHNKTYKRAWIDVTGFDKDDFIREFRRVESERNDQ